MPLSYWLKIVKAVTHVHDCSEPIGCRAALQKPRSPKVETNSNNRINL